MLEEPPPSVSSEEGTRTGRKGKTAVGEHEAAGPGDNAENREMIGE